MIEIKLLENEIKDLNEDEKEMALVRKLEIQLLPIVKRKMGFFYAGANISRKSESYNTDMDENEIEEALNNRGRIIEAVCRPLCEMVAKILKENGINAETVSCDTDIFRHVDVLITTSSGKQYIVNFLEDIENIQGQMKTPDFASKPYYERRYKKFEGGKTTDGKTLDNIAFLTEEQVDKIDENLGYKKYGIYMDSIIEQIRNEFENFRQIGAEDEILNELSHIESQRELTEKEKNTVVQKIHDKYNNMSDDDILEAKLDWIFNYFNNRIDIKGHADFVMYYSRLLLSKVLSSEEYGKITRYDCFTREEMLPEDSPIKDIIDYDSDEDKKRFCMIKIKNASYVFSVKPNVYAKLDDDQIENINKYAQLSKSQKPSDLVLLLADMGRALPLVFHPHGQDFINGRAEMIDPNLSDEERKQELQNIAKSIKCTDGIISEGKITSLSIPYPDGSVRKIYIDENNEFAEIYNGQKSIHHYDPINDEFKIETMPYMDDENNLNEERG